MSSPEETTKVDMSWQDVKDAVAMLLAQFREDSYEPSHIIAVAKGGVIPATLIHQAFPDAHFDTIYVRSYDAFRNPGVHRITGKIPVTPKWGNTLIVDDIFETGATYEFLRGIYPEATYAFMACRQKRAGQCKYRGVIYPPGWVTFPWEVPAEEIEIPF